MVTQLYPRQWKIYGRQRKITEQDWQRKTNTEVLTEKNRHRKKDRETLKENRQRQTALIIQYRERNTSKENKNKSHTKNARERKPLKDRQRK